MNIRLLPLLLLVASCAAEPDGPQCTNNGAGTVTRIQQLPSVIARLLPDKMVSAGEPFNVADSPPWWARNRPFMRLVCGYPVDGGYVIEREQGGAAYTLHDIVFRKTSAGYVVAYDRFRLPPARHGHAAGANLDVR